MESCAVQRRKGHAGAGLAEVLSDRAPGFGTRLKNNQVPINATIRIPPAHSRRRVAPSRQAWLIEFNAASLIVQLAGCPYDPDADKPMARVA